MCCIYYLLMVHHLVLSQLHCIVIVVFWFCSDRRFFSSFLFITQLFMSVPYYHFTLWLFHAYVPVSHCLSACALGANTYWSTAFHVYTPLPFYTMTQLFMFIFHYRFPQSHGCSRLYSTVILCTGCALGANTYWSTAFHVYTPLPFRPGRGFSDLFRTHFFVNAGNLCNVNFGKLYWWQTTNIVVLMRDCDLSFVVWFSI